MKHVTVLQLDGIFHLSTEEEKAEENTFLDSIYRLEGKKKKEFDKVHEALYDMSQRVSVILD